MRKSQQLLRVLNFSILDKLYLKNLCICMTPVGENDKFMYTMAIACHLMGLALALSLTVNVLTHTLTFTSDYS